MANYKGHIAGGILLSGLYSGALLFVPLTQFAEAAGVLRGNLALIAVFVIGVLFALFPDVDTNSKGQNIFYGLALVTDILLLWQGYIQAAAYLGLIAMLPIVGKHRGWTHSKPAMFLIPLPILVIPYVYNQKIIPIALVYYGAAVAGYFSHLLFDGLIFKHFRVKGSRYD
jgi:membrane-bound metal-dependent hydrolase YbcI (DUF457 family)